MKAKPHCPAGKIQYLPHISAPINKHSCLLYKIRDVIRYYKYTPRLQKSP